MSTSTLIELFGGFMAACFALWFVTVGLPSPRRALGEGRPTVTNQRAKQAAMKPPNNSIKVEVDIGKSAF